MPTVDSRPPLPAASLRSDNLVSGSSTITDQDMSALTASAVSSAKTFAAATGQRPVAPPPQGELMASFVTSGARAAKADDADEVDFDALIKDIRDNPDMVLKSDLTPEQVLELQRRINPYAFAPGVREDSAGLTVRSLATSYTNLREDYIRRFTMTSLVGFVFQILTEWTVPAEVRRWVPNPRRKKGGDAKAADPSTAPFNLDVLVGKLGAALEVAQEAQAAKKSFDAALQKAKEEMAVDDKSAAAAAAKAVSDEAAARVAGLSFAATRTVCRLGLDAEKRLDATIEEASQYPTVRAILEQSDVRPNTGVQIEIPPDVAKGIITNFMKHWLEFDPNIHVKAARDGKTDESTETVKTELGEVKTDKDDPARLPLEVLLAKAPKPTEEDADHVETFRASRENYNAACHALRDRELGASLIYALMSDENSDRFRRYLFPIPAKNDPLGRSEAHKALTVVPPQDTFHRWGYYTEVNYEELRTATECLYHEKPDLDWAIGIWEIFEGTPDEVQKRFDNYCERYQDEVPSSIKKLDLGGWNLLGDFKKGRENLKFYNKHTEILKRIIDRHTEDKKLGADLMRKRVRDLKSQNIAKEGPDAPGLTQYKKTATAVPSLGAERVISAVEMRRLEKARGDQRAAKELEVLEQYEAKIVEFGKIAANRPLSTEEKYQLQDAKQGLDRAIEMLNVPDEAVQVDTWTHDTSTGDFKKGMFYTKAEKPEHMEKIRQEVAQRTSGSMHPAVRQNEAKDAGRDLAPIQEEQRAAPTSTPADVDMEKLAPFAIQYMKLQEERTLATRKKEAEADAAAKAAGTASEAPVGAAAAAAAAVSSQEAIPVQIPGTEVTVPIPAGSVAVVIEALPAAAASENAASAAGSATTATPSGDKPHQ